MLTVRPSRERGHARHGWLESRHTFSFASYRDPRHMGFRDLRVINEDVVQPGKGFETHSHRDMEILSVVLHGALEHRDSMGNGSVIRPGDVQRMSAGSGVTHSEFNASSKEPVHFLQIWVLPEREGLPPGYEQAHFPRPERLDSLRLVASRDGREGSLTIHQDVDLYAAALQAGRGVTLPLRPGRYAWVQVAEGSLELNGTPLAAGDGAAVAEEAAVSAEALEPSELLLFDLR